MQRLDNAIWFEKYRPRTIDAMALQEHQVEAFNSFIEKQDIPHLLLFGPPGSGKTTMAQILTNNISCTTMSLNASSKDRGIETVRTKIKTFAQSKQMAGSFKVVFLDEADQMTPDAQAALRNTMETYSKYCRFILTANFVDKIIDPLQSRCRMFHFNQFPKDKLIKLLMGIVRRELVTVPKEDMEEIVDRFYPDIRTTINELQNACVNRKFDMSRIKSLNVDMREFLKLLKKGEIFKIRDMLADLTEYTFLYRWIYDEYLPEYGDNDQKAAIVKCVAEFQNSDVYTPDKEINFTACIVGVVLIMDISPKF